MPHKVQHHSHQHLTLQATLVIILAALGLNLYWEIFGISQITIITGLFSVLLGLILFVIPTVFYQTKVKYATDYESIEDAYNDISNINDPFFKEKVQNSNSHFQQLTEDKIEADKPFLRSRFNLEVQIEREKSVKNKAVKYNIKINNEQVMEGTITLYEDSDIVYIEETEETMKKMPILGTLLSEAKTVKMFERTAKRKKYKIENIEFRPKLRFEELDIDK